MATNNSSVPAGKSPNSDLVKRIQDAAKVMGITEEQVWLGLAKLGIKEGDADALDLLNAETTTEADAKVAFEKACLDIGPARFKAGWAVLKGGNQKAAAEQKQPKLSKVAEWTDQALVDAYGVECDSRIVDELNKRSKGQPFVIFNEDGSISSTVTVELLRCARRLASSQKMMETYPVEGTLRRLCRAGEFPQLRLEECPLHANTLLVNGYCDECQMSWAGVSMDARVVVRIAMNAKQIKEKSLAYIDRQKLIEMVSKDGGTSLLNIPPVHLAYYDAKEENCLPVLTRRVSKDSGGKDPFYVHKQY